MIGRSLTVAQRSLSEKALRHELPEDAEASEGLPSEVRIPDRFSRLAIAAASRALADAFGSRIPESLSCILTTTFNTRCSVEAWMHSLSSRPNPLVFPSATSAVTIGHVARVFGIRRSVTVLNGSNPIPLAMSWLQSGRESAVLVIAVDELRGIAPTLLDGPLKPGFSEAAGALVLSNEAASVRASCTLVHQSRASAFSERIYGQASLEGPLRESATAVLRSVGARRSADWGLCSVGLNGKPCSGEPSGWARIIQPREISGNTLAATPIAALCQVIEAPSAVWLVLDIDPYGTATALWVERA